MRRVKAEEDRRSAAEKQIEQLYADREKELQRWGGEEAERKQDLDEREGQIRAAEEELRKKGDERRMHENERQKLDAQIRALEKKAAQEDARAAKADITPPEKGGGPNTAANARNAADAARKEATALIPSRDVARARAEALDAPIATHTKQVVDGRAMLQQKRKDLVESQAAHKRTLGSFDVEKRRCEAERDGADREMSQRFVSAGTLLNLNRVQDPRFESIYQRIDELKSGVNAREAAIVRLETERRGFDKSAVQKGLITVGAAVGVLILLLILLIVLVGRH
jgi:dTMP kinase